MSSPQWWNTPVDLVPVAHATIIQLEDLAGNPAGGGGVLFVWVTVFKSR